MAFLYDFTAFFATLTIDTFFREITPRGSHQVPSEGAVIFVAAPHANQFVDPLILLQHCGRRVGFLIAKKSYDRPLIGLLARFMQAIPVARAQDYARKGTGQVSLWDPLTVVGHETRFTSELKPQSTLVLSDGRTGQVAQVLSDCEVKLARPMEPSSDKNKDHGKDKPSTSSKTDAEPDDRFHFKVYPYLDQHEVYEAVHARLNAGGCIGIFPEGGSHDRAEMLPLKAGVTVMALGALAMNERLEIKIVPCGLNYFNPHRFRSRAVIEFGKPLSVPADLVAEYKLGGTSKREACSALLQIIYSALRAVTVNTPDFETLQVIQAARRLYQPTESQLSMAQKLDMTRRFAEGYERFKDHPRVLRLRDKVLEYNGLLRAIGIRDHQVNKTAMSRSEAFFLLSHRCLKLWLLALLALPGVLLNSPIILVSSIISRRKAAEALRASSVKIAGRDVLATWKLLVAWVFGPLVYLTYALVYTYCFATPEQAWWRAMLSVLLCLPVLSLGTLRFFETCNDIYRSLPPLWSALLRRTVSQEVRHMRWELQNEVIQLVDDFAPLLYPNFDQERIVKQKRKIKLLPEHQEDVLQWQEATDDELDDVFFFKRPRSDGGLSDVSVE